MLRTCAVMLAGLAFLTEISFAQVEKPAGKQISLEVWLPANARLFIEDKATKSTGPVRLFFSPPLVEAKGNRYVYTLKAVIPDPGGEQVVTRRIEVKPGEHRKVDLRPDRAPDARYFPTPQEAVEAMLRLANVTRDDVVWDLGCGDGRIPVTAAKKHGCKARGFDIDPARVKDSLANIKKNGVGKLVTVERKDLFTLDLSKEPTVVTLYLLPDLNVKLLPQLRQLPDGARVVSHAHKMGSITPDEERTINTDEGAVTIYLWKVETLRAGKAD